jgi:hypothetical protein
MIEYVKRCKSIYILNINRLIESNRICKKIIAFYYFKFYEKQYIHSWYYSKKIDNKYRKIDKDKTITRYDLYNLIKKIPIEDTFCVGW